mgnify:CR=1 FL=1
MKYVSTRDNFKECSFEDVFIKGLADDGGLYVPVSLKKYSSEELKKLKRLNYNELSVEIINLFSSDFIPKKELSSLIEKSYSTFRETDVVKLSKVGEISLLELFHGPTLAFKDVAMQFIGNLYEYYLSKNDKKINIVVATSGDTGAAAIDSIKGKSNLNIFVLHPNNRISSVQRKIMTTVEEKNVFNIAIDGNFDDCQNIVKQMFSDLEFSKSINMSGVNSINWARIIAQTVYYFYAYFKLDKDTVSFSVPTGNFGDVFAGYLAKKMGLPVDKLIVATNENDILHRAISKGDYVSKEVKETLSPSMDIQLASNFERLIYYVNNSDPEKTAEILKDGWIYSGDKGKIDNNGSLHIVGRVKDAFKTEKGKYITPNPIEENLLKSDFLEQACVVGLTTPQPIALVNLSENGLKKNQNQIRSELKNHIDLVNQNLANYEKISTIIITTEAWSEHNKLLTPTLKVKRNKIDEKYMNKYLDWHLSSEKIIIES